MPPRLSATDEQQHLPARSGTPTAWATLGLLALLISGWLFFDTVACVVLRGALYSACWIAGDTLSIKHLSLERSGRLQARGIDLTFGPADSRSHWTCEWLEVQPSAVKNWLMPQIGKPRRFLQGLYFGKSKLLVDRRKKSTLISTAPSKVSDQLAASWPSWLPDAVSGGPTDLVVIGNDFRIASSSLYLHLPDRWPGRISYEEMTLDAGTWHRAFGPCSAAAFWDASTLRLVDLRLEQGVTLEDLTLALGDRCLEFGWSGAMGKGRLRGDGSIGSPEDPGRLEMTLVGEKLSLDLLAGLGLGEKKASGTIRQARFTFRGDPSKPLEGDSSLRLAADTFHWEGRGWDSLRLSATLTGRTLTLAELILRQQENEFVATGHSNLPADWRMALRAPFTATFSATLADAGALGALGNKELSALSGGLIFDGWIKGADNKAEGYCNLEGDSMKFWGLSIDWMKGCLLFEGETTRLSNLQVLSGEDRLVVEGSVENSRPHKYKASAQLRADNLTRLMSQLGLAAAKTLGGGALKCSWSGEGTMKTHAGTFQATINELVSPWTLSGVTGQFKGSYTPEALNLSKAEFLQRDLRLGMQLCISQTSLTATGIVAVREGKQDPLADGEVTVPFGLLGFLRGDAPSRALRMDGPISLRLGLHGIGISEMADLLGQKISCTGLIRGELFATGTPEKPEIKASLHAAGLSVGGASEIEGMEMEFQSHNGRGALQLVQGSGPKAPLALHADVPFRWERGKEGIRLSNLEEPLRGDASLQGFAPDGWLALAGARPFIGSLVDAKITFGGTPLKPTVEGSMDFHAKAFQPVAPLQLRDLAVKASCSGTKAIIQEGTARQGGASVSVSGLMEWEKSPWQGKVEMAGTNLSLPTLPALGWLGLNPTEGDATVVLRLKGAEPPQLSGAVTVKAMADQARMRITPFFCPPGILPRVTSDGNDSEQKADMATDMNSPTLDLSCTTAGPLALSPSASKKLNGSLCPIPTIDGVIRVEGTADHPKIIGTITARDALAELPAGFFHIPQATFQYKADLGVEVAARAFGMTRLGPCVLEENGTLGASQPTLFVPPGVSPAKMIMALVTPGKQSDGNALRSLPRQAVFCARQEALFPTSPVGWQGDSEGRPDYSALGFYGSAWDWQVEAVSRDRQDPATLAETQPRH